MTRTLALIALLASLYGCASTTRIDTTFSSPAVVAATRLLLAGRTVEQGLQQQWERQCRKALQVDGVEVVLLHQVSPDAGMASPAQLSTLAQQLEVDATLSIELTALLFSAPQMPPDNIVSVERQPGMAASTVPSYDIRLRGQKAPAQLPDKQQIAAQFDDADGTILWRGTLISHEANEIEAMARSQCRSLKKTLQKLQLI